jgi:dCMP deaminase
MDSNYSPAGQPGLTPRPTLDEWGLEMAKTTSLRGECTRRRVGAFILDHSRRQTWLGCNGAPPGEPSCLDGACPRGRHYLIPRSERIDASTVSQCACGNPWPCNLSAPVDSSYDTGEHACNGTHAELAALIAAGRGSLNDDCVMYVSEKPCPACERIIKGCLKRVVWPGGELVF